MNKSLEAMFRGYYKFHVNGRKFHLYNSALKHRKYLLSFNINVWFTGTNIFGKEKYFYISWRD